MNTNKDLADLALQLKLDKENLLILMEKDLDTEEDYRQLIWLEREFARLNK